MAQLDNGTELSPKITQSNNSRDIALLEQVISQLAQKEGNTLRQTNQNNYTTLSPENILVIIGLLSGTLKFSSILIGIDQAVQIRVDGSLTPTKPPSSPTKFPPS